MDITDLLSNDHATVDALFDRYRATSDASERDEITRQVVHDLSVHAAVEEQFVYPLVRVKLDGRTADHAIDEHQEAKQLLADLEKAEAGTAEHEQLFDRLVTAIREHVAEEEGEVFPELRSKTDEATREKIASVVDKAKAVVPTHPHPLVPPPPSWQPGRGQR